MKKTKILMLASLMAVAISVEAKFIGWDTNWTFSYTDGNCMV